MVLVIRQGRFVFPAGRLCSEPSIRNPRECPQPDQGPHEVGSIPQARRHATLAFGAERPIPCLLCGVSLFRWSVVGSGGEALRKKDPGWMLASLDLRKANRRKLDNCVKDLFCCAGHVLEFSNFDFHAILGASDLSFPFWNLTWAPVVSFWTIYLSDAVIPESRALRLQCARRWPSAGSVKCNKAPVWGTG